MHPLLNIPLEDFRDREMRPRVVPGRDDGGVIEIWEEPAPGGWYVIGTDTSYGISDGGDYDADCVLRTDVTPCRQVAECHGQWPTVHDRLLCLLGRYYNDALICIERQTMGLPIMRRLHDGAPDGFAYRRLYFERDEIGRGRDIRDALGHPKSAEDLVVLQARMAVAERSVLVRSSRLLDQMKRVRFRKKKADPNERPRDRDRKIVLPGGGSPDLVMAFAFALLAMRNQRFFPPVSREWGPGTVGEAIGYPVPGRRMPSNMRPFP